MCKAAARLEMPFDTPRDRKEKQTFKMSEGGLWSETIGRPAPEG